MIEGIKEKEDATIIETKVVGGDFKGESQEGKNYAFWIRDNNKFVAISILTCFFTEEQLMSSYNIEDMIGRKMKGKCKAGKNPKYVNVVNLEAVSDVPDMAEAMGAPESVEQSTEDGDDLLF